MLTAAVSAVLFAGVANAAITENGAGLPLLNLSDTAQVFVSGASAPGNFMDQLFTNNTIPSASRLCDTTKTIYRFQSASGSPLAANSDQRAYLCVLNTGSAAGASVAAGAKKNVIVYKRNKDGSAMGVNPLVVGTEGDLVSFLNADVTSNTGCVKVGAAVNNVVTINCPWVSGAPASSQSVVSDLGVSDVEPILFQGTNGVAGTGNQPTGFATMDAASVAKLTVKPAATQVFGVIVNTKLRNALQMAQFAPANACNPLSGSPEATLGLAKCQPTLTSADITSIFTGKIASWKQLYLKTATASKLNLNVFDNVPAADVNKADSDRVHICSRTSGSGTRASFSALFLEEVCSDTGYAHPSDTTTTVESTLKPQVHNMSSGGNVGKCMNELNNASYQGTGTVLTTSNTPAMTGDRWAIGIQGTENNISNSDEYRFIKIDGVEPTLANAASGRYKWWSELTFQYNTIHYNNIDSDTRTLIDSIVTEAGNKTVAALTNPTAKHLFGQAGFMAIPQNTTAPQFAIVDLTQPVNPLSRSVGGQPSTCRLPTLFNPGANFLRGLQMN